jgi:NADH-quinone oxidoreductase subunit C
MHNWYENKRVKIKTFINGENRDKNHLYFPKCKLDGERLMILRSRLHRAPSLKRILNMDEMISFPMQKSFLWKMADEPIKTTVFSVEQSTIAKKQNI